MRVLRSQSETANWPRALANIPSPMVFVEMDPRLGVAAGGQAVPAGQELLAQLGILEQLAVEGDPDRAVFVGDRLPAPGQVDDRQPPGPQRHARLDVELLVVGTAVGDRAGHRQQALGGKLARPGQINRAGDATHGTYLSCRDRRRRRHDRRVRRLTEQRRVQQVTA